MKLISCTIDNFGKLHNYHCRFDPDLHVTAEENGWGKTTLAAFLLAMFYGLEGDSRRKDSQRSRYQPWNGGACGGRLVFETGDGRFRAERTFGTKPRQDTFTLYDERTGLISDRYAADLGREIFGIDRESFCNTVFTSGSAGDTAPTAGIQARIRTPLPDADDLSDKRNSHVFPGPRPGRQLWKKNTGSCWRKSRSRNGTLRPCRSAERN